MEGIDIIQIDRSNIMEERSKRYLEQYYRLSAEAYQSDSVPDQCDLYKDTVYLLAVKKGADKVVAGGQWLFSSPEDRKKLRFESSVNIGGLLPHVDQSTLSYAEMAGVVADPQEANAGLLGLNLQKHMIRMVKNGELPPTDVFIGRVTPKNVPIALRSLQSEDLGTVVRDDVDISSKGGQPLTIVTYSPSKDFPLLSEEMQQSGVGVPGNEFLARSRARKIEERSRHQ